MAGQGMVKYPPVNPRHVDIPTCYQGQAHYALTEFRTLHYETWLFRFLGSEICFKGHFGHKGGPKIKIEGPKEKDFNISSLFIIN
jgi:hypothetical protein